MEIRRPHYPRDSYKEATESTVRMMVSSHWMVYLHITKIAVRKKDESTQNDRHLQCPDEHCKQDGTRTRRGKDEGQCRWTLGASVIYSGDLRIRERGCGHRKCVVVNVCDTRRKEGLTEIGDV